MPAEGKLWWHVIISTLNSWLPADARGFRSRNHKIHSSGDYKNPPPKEEHEGLRKYQQKNAVDVVVIPDESKETVGRAILAKLAKLEHRCLVLSVASTHSHWLVELPEDEKTVRKIVGECKTKSSHAIRDVVPGRVWAFRGKFIPVKDREQQNTYRYILGQEDAWIWDYKQEPTETKDDDAQEAQG